jgi:glycosyltransferase involved in cell wall biosynthesis
MRIVDVSYVYDEALATEEELLEQHYTTVGWAEALAKKGAEVIVLKRFFKTSSFKKNNVQYFFVKDSYNKSIRSWQLPFRLFRKIASLQPDIVHLHHLSLSMQTFTLRSFLNKKTAIVVQHHGGGTPKGKKKAIHDQFNSIADSFFFTTIEQGKEWFPNKKVHNKILPVMEGCTFFNYNSRLEEKDFFYHNRNETRKITTINGDPVFLWVGRLDENKDPLTILDGFEEIFQKFPAARLYMIYSDDKLIVDVRNKIDNSDILKPRVRLLGKIAHYEIQNYYNSADFFVLGSHYEGSGYALSEALRCGCVPIVTDIPSFRMMTENGQLGALWEPGNKNSFIQAAISASDKSLREEAERCIDFFNKDLSFDAIAEKAIKHYQETIEFRRKKKR